MSLAIYHRMDTVIMFVRYAIHHHALSACSYLYVQ